MTTCIVNGQRTTYIECWPLLNDLNEMVVKVFIDVRSQFYVSEWIRNGWIYYQEGDESCFSRIIKSIHSVDAANSNAAYRIARQLLALGIFREPGASSMLTSHCSCFNNRCDESNVRPPRRKNQYPHLLPLLNGFFRETLSLLQLSRIEIRDAVGMRYFERRVKTLSLPPLLLTYVWHANEMLDEVLFRDSSFESLIASKI